MKYIIITTILSAAGFIMFPETVKSVEKVEYFEFEPIYINVGKK